jgi:hypothetical protein
MSIRILDNLITKKEQQTIWNELQTKNYLVGEIDRPGLPPTGSVAELLKEDKTFKIINNKLINFIDTNKIYRSYINCFFPNENPYFHIDKDKGTTILYYANLENYELDEGGETQFLLEEIKGVRPIPGRIVLFDSNILHKATSFRSRNRYTVAFKYD